MCGWPPGWQEVFHALGQRRPLAVMCPACCRGRWPQAPMGTVDRDLIKLTGSQCPFASVRVLSIRRLTDDAITRVYPRKPFRLASDCPDARLRA